MWMAALPVCADEELTTAQGLKYLLHLPSSYDEDEGAPLIVCLHGRGSSARNEFGMWKGQGRGAILAAPDAPNPGEWNFDKDLKPVVQLTLALQKKYQPTYTLVGGFSRGGYFSHYLGLRNPRVYQGIVAFVASCQFEPPRTPEAKALAVFVANGDQDEMTPLKHAHATVQKFRAAGYPHFKYFEMKGVGHSVSGEAWDECWTFIDKVVAKPREAARLYDRAKAAADAKQNEEALELLEELLANYADAPAAAKAKELKQRLEAAGK